MFFTNTVFLFIFLPIFFIVYFLIPKKFKNITIVIFSLIFYSFFNLFYLSVLIFLTLSSFVITIPLANRENEKLRKVCFSIMLAIYIVFFVLFLFLKLCNKNTLDLLYLQNPIGMNFYILSGISYLIDVYQNRCPRQRNFIDYCVYITMFPKLLAGPVVIYRNFIKQLRERQITAFKIKKGIELLIIGLSKKVILADNIILLFDSINKMDSTQIPFLTAWLGAISVVFAIYFDFSGYVDMARGIAKIIGFNLPKNFNYPIGSVSVIDFFRRFNITLINFLKYYITDNIKLNKNIKFYLNVSVISILYVIFFAKGVNGLLAASYFIIILSLENLLENFLKKIPIIVRRIITFILVSLGAVLYENSDILFGIKYFINMLFANKLLFDIGSIYYFTSYILIIAVAFFASNSILKRYIYKYIRKNRCLYDNLKAIALIILFIISICYMVSETISEIAFIF